MKRAIVVVLFLLLASGYAWSSGFIGGGFFNMDMGSPGPTEAPFDPGDALLLEIGDFLLLESADKLLLE